jgi:hypothetical protein
MEMPMLLSRKFVVAVVASVLTVGLARAGGADSSSLDRIVDQLFSVRGLSQVAIQVVYPQGPEMIEEFSREVIAKY